MEDIRFTTIRSGERQAVQLPISEEVPLTVEVNGKELATFLCSPADLENLVTGFLYTSGLMKSPSSMKRLTIDRDRWRSIVEIEADGLPEDLVFKRVYATGCGKGVLFYNPLDLLQQKQIASTISVESEVISGFMKELLSSSGEYKNTHGVHSCALATPEKIIIVRDDIGRHNAVDKVIGEAVSRDLDFTDKIFLMSGRVSSEIVSKVIRIGCPVVIAAGAPTNQAVKLARSVGLTLAGMARGKNMNLYSGDERII